MADVNKIPFLDIVTPHLELEEELCAIFRNALQAAEFIGGPILEEFERNFAEFCNARYCIGVASGTDALRFALMAAQIPLGSIVITVPNTFIATTEAISQAGAIPQFVDVDERTYNMDPLKLREYLETECTTTAGGPPVHRMSGAFVSAVIPVHLYGQMADMNAIQEIADHYGMVVIEDACQAHGAQYFSEQDKAWKVAGSSGKAAAFSFYPGKNLGACGEAGAVTTNDLELASRVRRLRDHGQARKYFHDVEGYNGRLDAIQAGILNAKLQRLSEWNGKRRKVASRYEELLRPLDNALVLPHEPAWSQAVHHLYVLQVEDRDGLQRHLADEGIGTGIHYPVPLHLQRAYSGLRYKPGDFPIAEAAASRIISLPMYPGLEAEQQIRVVEAVSSFATPARSRQLSCAAGAA